jgi:hypothetical protein
LTPYQKINHFPNSYELTRKDCMYRNISRMQALYGKRHFSFVPTTYILPQDIPQLKKEHNPSISYIIKPSAKSQGKGIYLL